MRALLLSLVLLLALPGCGTPRYNQAEEERKLDLALAAYSDRIMDLATSYASSAETAPDAADAAIAGAATEYRAMEAQTVRWHAITYRDGRLDSKQGYRLAAGCRDDYRAKALERIMELRLATQGRKPTL